MLGSVLRSSLNIGETLARFQAFGNIPVVTDWFIIKVRSGEEVFVQQNPPHAIHAFSLYQRPGSEVVMSVCQHGDDLMWRASGGHKNCLVVGVENDLKIGIFRRQ